MATVNMLPGATTSTTHMGPLSTARAPYLVEVEIDLATAATTKGSALASADIIQCIRVPAGSVVMFAGFQIKTAQAGGSADQAVTLGDTGSAARWVGTFDLDAAVAGDYSTTLVVASTNPTLFATASSVDLTISAGTTIGTSGLIRVFAMLVNVADMATPGTIAAIAS